MSKRLFEVIKVETPFSKDVLGIKTENKIFKSKTPQQSALKAFHKECNLRNKKYCHLIITVKDVTPERKPKIYKYKIYRLNLIKKKDINKGKSSFQVKYKTKAMSVK